MVDPSRLIPHFRADDDRIEPASRVRMKFRGLRYSGGVKKMAVWAGAVLIPVRILAVCSRLSFPAPSMRISPLTRSGCRAIIRSA
jgi:hypothetical protein